MHAIKQLTASAIKNNAGRSSVGRVVCYTKGTCARHRLRFLNSVQSDCNIPGTIIRIEHDALRSGLLALVRLAHSICNYKLLANGLCVGDTIVSYLNVGSIVARTVALNIGDSSRVLNMPRGVILHDLERYVGFGGSISRSAGSFSMLLYKFTGIMKCLIKIPSGSQ